MVWLAWSPPPEPFVLGAAYVDTAPVVDHAVILAQKPVAYWRLGEAGGTVAHDSSGHGHHGIYEGDPALGLVGIAADDDTAMRLVESPAWMRAPNVPVGRSFTILAWARSLSPRWNRRGWIVSARSPNGFLIHPDLADVEVGMYVLGSPHKSPKRMGTVTPMDITEWHQYGLMYDSRRHRASIVLDGEVVETKNYSGSKRRARGKVEVHVGVDPCCPDRYGEGAIDEVALFNRALTPEELKAQFRPRD